MAAAAHNPERASKTLFISDLHLDERTPAITQTFLHFLHAEAAGCRALYILGDLFEAWVGDDDQTPLSEQVAGALQEVSAMGTEVFLMHGNRDFLLGEDYARQCGARLLPEPSVIDCHGQRAVLVHGDSLCTRDSAYMAFREMVRNPQWQQEFLSRSLVERYMIAQQAREQSAEANSNKAADIMDVTPSEVIQLLQQEQCNLLIHGHTHRPAVHSINLEQAINGNSKATRIVLGDWHQKGWVLVFDDSGYELRHFPLQAAAQDSSAAGK